MQSTVKGIDQISSCRILHTFKASTVKKKSSPVKDSSTLKKISVAVMFFFIYIDFFFVDNFEKKC